MFLRIDGVLSLISRRRGGARRRGGSPVSVRSPGLVVAGGGGAAPALQGMPRRPVGLIGAGPVGLVVLLPGAPRRPAFRRDGVARVMQPAVPFRRHAARLDLALVAPPAVLPAQRPTRSPPPHPCPQIKAAPPRT